MTPVQQQNSRVPATQLSPLCCSSPSWRFGKSVRSKAPGTSASSDFLNSSVAMWPGWIALAACASRTFIGSALESQGIATVIAAAAEPVFIDERAVIMVCSRSRTRVQEHHQRSEIEQLL